MGTYTQPATETNPALIIYLLDVSASMAQPLGDRRRIDVVIDSVQTTLRQLIARSSAGGAIAARYRIAMLAYSDQVYDLLGGVRSIAEIARLGVPTLRPWRTTDTARALAHAAALLEAELPGQVGGPAPLVCHLTDGEYTGADPMAMARRLMSMATPDGTVLLENILIAGQPGDPVSELLAAVSSPLPESYRATMGEGLCPLAPGSLMLFPASDPETVALGFQMSAAAPVR